MLSYEGESFKGVQGIMEKLTSMPAMKMNVDSLDAQPSVNNGIAVMIGGTLIIEGSENPLKFA